MKSKQYHFRMMAYKSGFSYRLTVVKILFFLFWLFGFSVYAQDTCPESIKPAQDEHELVENMYWLVVNSDFERLIEEDYIHCFFNGDITYVSDDPMKPIKPTIDDSDIDIHISIKNILSDKNYEMNIERYRINHPLFIETSLSISGIDEHFFPIPDVEPYFEEIDIDEAYKYWTQDSYKLVTSFNVPEGVKSESSKYSATAHKCIAQAHYIGFYFEKVNTDGNGNGSSENNTFNLYLNKYNRNSKKFKENCH